MAPAAATAAKINEVLLLASLSNMARKSTDSSISSRAIRCMLTLCVFLASQILSCLLLNCIRKRIVRHLSFRNIVRLYQAAFQMVLRTLPNSLVNVLMRWFQIVYQSRKYAIHSCLTFLLARREWICNLSFKINHMSQISMDIYQSGRIYIQNSVCLWPI